MISNLGPFEAAPSGWSRAVLKIVRDDEAAAAWLWPVPPPGHWENPRGVSYSRVAHLPDLAGTDIRAWAGEHQTPGTLVIVSGAYGTDPSQAEGAPVLEVLVRDEQAATVRDETRAEHYQRTGLRYPGSHWDTPPRPPAPGLPAPHEEGKAETASGYYGQMSDQEFWADVASLLDLIGQHHGGSPASQVGGLADYVLNEAERRDPELAAAVRRRQELVKAAGTRLPLAFEAIFEPLLFTDEENAERLRLIAGYTQRVADLAARARQ